MDTVKTTDQLAPKSDKQPKHLKHAFFQQAIFALRTHPFHDVATVILLAVLVLSIVFFAISPGVGTVVGLGIGSFEGVPSGLADGAKDGNAEGLSAKDTTMDIRTKMVQTGKLEVLLVNVELSDVYKHGEVPIVGGPQYAALYTIQGEGIFSVDLTQAEVTLQSLSDNILIGIPRPQFELYIKDSTLKNIAEYKASVFDGNTGDGYTGWLNSREQIDQKAQSELAGYNSLMEHAKASALDQVERLSKSICGSEKKVIVQFLEEEDE